jgi:hypothetical protein
VIHFDRRRALISTAGLAAGGMATARLLPEEILLRDRRPARSRVAILSAGYSEGLGDSLLRALRLFGLRLRGTSVLLKPSLPRKHEENGLRKPPKTWLRRRTWLKEPYLEIMN